MERSSKLKLALGAASLFLFLVGVKRTFRGEDGSYLNDSDEADSRLLEEQPRTQRSG